MRRCAFAWLVVVLSLATPSLARAQDSTRRGGQVELLQALLKLANQLQSNLDLDAVVDVIAGALCDTFGFVVLVAVPKFT